MVDPNQIQTCKQQLKPLLEQFGDGVFCSAVQEVLNEHPSTLPTPGYSWEVLFLPDGYEPEQVWEAAIASCAKASKSI